MTLDAHRNPAPTEPLRALDPEEWLTGLFLQGRLRVSRSTIRRWRKRGLPSVGSGKHRRYKWGVVLAFLGDQAHESAARPSTEASQNRSHA